MVTSSKVSGLEKTLKESDDINPVLLPPGITATVTSLRHLFSSVPFLNAAFLTTTHFKTLKSLALLFRSSLS